MEVPISQLPPGDTNLVEAIVNQLKSRGIFDKFRKECLADVDTKPAFQNLRQRVDGHVKKFLGTKTWKSDMNKNQIRDGVRKDIQESGILEAGIQAIISQVVTPKITPLILPYVEDTVYTYLQIEKPKREAEDESKYEETQASIHHVRYNQDPMHYQGLPPHLQKNVYSDPPKVDSQKIKTEPKDLPLIEVKKEETQSLKGSPEAIPMATDAISSEEDETLLYSNGNEPRVSTLQRETSDVKMEEDNAVDSFDSARNDSELVTAAVDKLSLRESDSYGSVSKSEDGDNKAQAAIFDQQSLDSISSNSSNLSFSPLPNKGKVPSGKTDTDDSLKDDISMDDLRSSQSTPLEDEKSASSQTSADHGEWSGIALPKDLPAAERITIASFSDYVPASNTPMVVSGAGPVSAESSSLGTSPSKDTSEAVITEDSQDSVSRPKLGLDEVSTGTSNSSSRHSTPMELGSSGGRGRHAKSSRSSHHKESRRDKDRNHKYRDDHSSHRKRDTYRRDRDDDRDRDRHPKSRYHTSSSSHHGSSRHSSSDRREKGSSHHSSSHKSDKHGKSHKSDHHRSHSSREKSSRRDNKDHNSSKYDSRDKKTSSNATNNDEEKSNEINVSHTDVGDGVSNLSSTDKKSHSRSKQSADGNQQSASKLKRNGSFKESHKSLENGIQLNNKSSNKIELYKSKDSCTDDQPKRTANGTKENQKSLSNKIALDKEKDSRSRKALQPKPNKLLALEEDITLMGNLNKKRTLVPHKVAREPNNNDRNTNKVDPVDSVTASEYKNGKKLKENVETHMNKMAKLTPPKEINKTVKTHFKNGKKIKGKLNQSKLIANGMSPKSMKRKLTVCLEDISPSMLDNAAKKTKIVQLANLPPTNSQRLVICSFNSDAKVLDQAILDDSDDGSDFEGFEPPPKRLNMDHNDLFSEGESSLLFDFEGFPDSTSPSSDNRVRTYLSRMNHTGHCSRYSE